MYSPKITVAMATFVDFHGVYFTIQNIRKDAINAGIDPSSYEILVLDNAPDTEHGRDVEKYCNDVGVRYETFTEKQSTSATRSKLFDLARGELVCVLDCHLITWNLIETLHRLMWQGAAERDLYTGPLFKDNLTDYWTHWNPNWSNGMKGQWSLVWEHEETKELVYTRKVLEGLEYKLEYTKFRTDWNTENQEWIKTGLHFETPLELRNSPNKSKILWEHKSMKELGFRKIFDHPSHQSVEIPAMGLGLFAAWKEHWLGFHDDQKAFGGEEGYIHEKYRQHGRKCWCVKDLRWGHRFYRPDGIPYMISQESKMRNYYLHWQELGLDTGEIRKHFVEGPEVGVNPEEWDKLIADPVNYDDSKAYPPNTRPDNVQAREYSENGLPLPNNQESLFAMAMEMGADTEHPICRHAKMLMNTARRCNSLAVYSDHRETDLFLVAGMTQVTNGTNKLGDQVKLISMQKHKDYLSQLVRNVHLKQPGRKVDWITYVGSDAYEWDLSEPVDTVVCVNPTQDLLTRVAKHTDEIIVIRTEDDIAWVVCPYVNSRESETCVTGVRVFRAPSKGGPGTWLMRFFRGFGFRPEPGCDCYVIARVMDSWGPEMCLAETEYLVPMIRTEAAKRRLRFLLPKWVLRNLIKLACWAS
jgi:hypothetical protein